MAGATSPWGSAKESTHIAKIAAAAAVGAITAGNAPGDEPDDFADVVGGGKLVQADGNTSNRLIKVVDQDDLGQSASVETFTAQGEDSAESVAGVPDINEWNCTIAFTPTDALHRAIVDEGGDGWNIGDQCYIAIVGGWSHSAAAPAAGSTLVVVKAELAARSFSPAISGTASRYNLTFALKSTPRVLSHGTS